MQRFFTLTEAREKLVKKELSVTQLIEEAVTTINTTEKKLHAFNTLTLEQALEKAAKIDRQGTVKDIGPMGGIPIGYKDNFCTKGVRTTASSNILGNYIPIYNATVVDRYEKAGAISVGKLNCDAFAHGSSGENSDFGPTKNPWNLEYVPGGSSSGSGALVASGGAFLATGTDTGGSIRLPASFCGIVGLKPSYGRVSRYGIVAMTSSTDSIGCLTRSVKDAALALEVTAGKDIHDGTTVDKKVESYTSFCGKPVKGMTIGIPKEYFVKGIEKEVVDATEKAIEVYKSLGVKIKEVSLPHTEYATAVYYIVTPSEVSSNLARYDGVRYGYSDTEAPDMLSRYFNSRRDGFGAEAKRRIMIGTYALSSGYYDAYYKKAQQVRTLVCDDFKKAFQKVDLLLAPVSPTLPFKIGEKASDPLQMYLSDILTIAVNLAGVPGLAIPCGFAKGLPIGIQVIAPQFEEAKMFQAGYAYEQETKWHTMHPTLGENNGKK
ncbi:MAG TPA: Asp-tRNA(Asn)/Glu-tRNA(Gln) amidotransferase subunit GatA [Patescibacteria group bacterium]|nr:Asp-tRNA(Asn)/Glu-tRNA(Gln) amidotransferase subunit GatA [Patescibacteria group bacterium]